MYYTNVFCSRFSLEAGISVIAWFYISIYFVNCFVNIFASDIVKAYADSVDNSVESDDSNLVGFHYVCLVFGIITILIAAGILLKFANQSETFLTFVVKWNILRCFLLLIAILFGCIVFDHIFTLFLSCIVLITDFCFSVYFTGVLASYLKSLSIPDLEQGKNSVGTIQLISHTKVGTRHEETASSSNPKVEIGRANNGTILEEPEKVKVKESTGVATKEDKTSVEDNEVKKNSVLVKNEESSPQVVGVSNEAMDHDEQLTPCREEKGSQKDQKGSTEDKEGSTDNKKGSTEDEKGSTEDEKGSTEDHGGLVEDKEGPTEDEKGSTEDQKVSTEDREESTENQTESTEDQKGSTEDEKGSTKDEEGSAQDQAGSLEDQKASTGDDSGTPES